MGQEDNNDSRFSKFVSFLKKRYGLESGFELLLIVIQFSITGSSAVRIGRMFLNLIGVDDNMSPFIFWPIRLIGFYLIYQVLFIIYGYIIGLYKKPVWRFTKMFSDRMLSRFGIKFMSNNSSKD